MSQQATAHPCRQASKRILAVLQRFGVCERGGMDEMLVDVTAEAQRRIAQGSVPATWAAHVHSNKVQQHMACPKKYLQCELDVTSNPTVIQPPSVQHSSMFLSCPKVRHSKLSKLQLCRRSKSCVFSQITLEVIHHSYSRAAFVHKHYNN